MLLRAQFCLMVKKKKKIHEAREETDENEDIIAYVASDVKRSVAAVFLFSLSVVMFLGFLNKAGIAGKLINTSAGALLGWAKFIFPLFLIVAGLILLLRKKFSFYVSKLIGLGITLFAIAGLFHWFFDVDKMAGAAKDGSGGGYIGYAVAFLAVKLLSRAGSAVMIVSLFIIGFIVAFNVSILQLIHALYRKPSLQEEPEEQKEATATDEVDNKKEEAVSRNIEPEAKEKDSSDHNIGKIEFVEGPDQYVDEKLLQNARPEKSLAKRRYAKEGNPGKLTSLDDDWEFPPLDLLEKSSGMAKGGDVEKNADIIEKTLKHFGIEVERGEIKTGPSVTQYSFRPAVGIKISRILALQNDLALALAAHPIRIEAPIPGKSMIGIEVPNKVSTIVRLRSILEHEDFVYRKSNLTLVLGEDVSGNYIYANLEKMPHLLIAGATGTGKSVCINSIIVSLLYQNSPDNLKLIVVDPKRVELAPYNHIPHLLSEVIVENGKVVGALRWAVGEMERRYRLLQDNGSRDIASYQEKLKSGHKRKYTDPETGEAVEEEMEKIPYIVIIIDELADLMGSHGKEVEGAIVRIAQMARAVGIHLILSTQRPSVEVITGLIKANITTRVAFQVATQIDSRTIIDMGGAEKLLGNGDLLYLSSSSPKPKRIQGVFVSESEVKRVVSFIKKHQKEENIGEDITSTANSTSSGKSMLSEGDPLEFKNIDEFDREDNLYEEAKEEVIRAKKASASLLQRRLRIGYARAARLLDILEDKGVVGPSDGAKPREVYTASSSEVHYEDPMRDQEKREKWQL